MTKKEIPFLTAVCLLFFLVSSVFSQERTMTLGGKDGWPSLSVSNNIICASGRYGYDSLMLKNNARQKDKNTDMLLSFDNSAVNDEAGNYTVIQGSMRSTSLAKLGNGAALCPGSENGIAGLVLQGKKGSFFGTTGSTGSFTIEFWLYPSVAENGETIFSWRSSRNVESSSLFQMMRASFFSGHMEWRFLNIFSGYSANQSEIVLTSDSLIIPDVWSHHCLSFDEDTGLLEYRINGQLEAIKYVTSNGYENGDIYTVVLGDTATVEICSKYTGTIDDFRISRAAVTPEYHYNLYPAEGGRFETQPIFISAEGAQFQKLNGIVQKPEETGIQYFVRAGDNFYGWTDDYPEWKPVSFGETIEGVEGIYFQIAGELYTNGNCDVTPSVAEFDITYSLFQAPLPPYKISAVAGDGCVDLVWNESASPLVDGYVIYYGERPGEYMGQAAAEGSSPIECGKAVSYRLTGLKNGKIYYFAVAAFNDTITGERLTGETSVEVYARPTPNR